MIFPLVIWIRSIKALTHSSLISSGLNTTLLASRDNKVRTIFRWPFLYLGIKAVMIWVGMLILKQPRITAMMHAVLCFYSLLHTCSAVILLVRWRCHQRWSIVLYATNITTLWSTTPIDIGPWIISRNLSASLSCPTYVLTLRPDVKCAVLNPPLSRIIDDFKQLRIIDNRPLYHIVIAIICTALIAHPLFRCWRCLSLV